MTRVSVPTSRRPPRTAHKVSSRNVVVQERTSRWTCAEHGAYLKSVWGRALASWQQAADCVGTRTPQQLRSHNQKMEKRVLQAVVRGRLSDHYVDPYAEHCFPSIDDVVNRMANDDRFRFKMIGAIYERNQRKTFGPAQWDDHSDRLLEAIAMRLGPNVLALAHASHDTDGAIASGFAINGFATNADESSCASVGEGKGGIGLQDYALGEIEDEGCTSSDGGDTDDSVSIASGCSPPIFWDGKGLIDIDKDQSSWELPDDDFSDLHKFLD